MPAFYTEPVDQGNHNGSSTTIKTLLSTPSAIYAPYGEPYDGVGTSQKVYGVTGEPTDANALVYLRARYLSPGLGVFTSRDPFEGITDSPMSLNGYSWVEGNVANAVDPSGEIMESPATWNACFAQQIPSCGSANIMPTLPYPSTRPTPDPRYETMGPHDSLDPGVKLVSWAVAAAIWSELWKWALWADIAGQHDASRHMSHYLHNSGQTLDIDVSRLITDLPSFNADIQAKLHEHLLPQLNYHAATNNVGVRQSFSSYLSAGDNGWIGYQDTRENLNWTAAMGSFHYTFGANVVVTSFPDRLHVQTCYVVYVFDEYDWHPGLQDGDVPDQIPGFLHQWGMAQEYEMQGVSQVFCEEYDVR